MKHKITYRSETKSNHPIVITITQEEYDRLLAQDHRLQLLEAKVKKIKELLEKLT